MIPKGLEGGGCKRYDRKGFREAEVRRQRSSDGREYIRRGIGREARK
jgi:hypothetical protein